MSKTQRISKKKDKKLPINLLVKKIPSVISHSKNRLYFQIFAQQTICSLKSEKNICSIDLRLVRNREEFHCVWKGWGEG